MKDNKLNELFEYTQLKENIDLNYIDISEFNDDDDLKEYIQERIYEHEIIYYSNAIEYLKEYDCSLCESMSIASEYGFNAENLTSETLATLLCQSLMSNELYNTDLSELFE